MSGTPKHPGSTYSFDYWYEIARIQQNEAPFRSMGDILKFASGAESRIERWVLGYLDAAGGDDNLAWSWFRDDWRRIRVWVPLQFRLCVEQVCYDLGNPWRSVVTGFNPIGGATAASAKETALERASKRRTRGGR